MPIPGSGLFAKMAANVTKVAPKVPAAVVSGVKYAATLSLNGTGTAPQNSSSTQQSNFFESNAGLGTGVVLALAFMFCVGCAIHRLYGGHHRSIVNRAATSMLTNNSSRSRRLARGH